MYHPGIAHAGPVRRQLEGPDDHESARTVPQSGAPEGSAARRAPIPSCCGRIAETLARWASSEALVVHGSGLDEVALHGFTQAVRLTGGELEELEITPEEAGLRARCRWSRSTGGYSGAKRARLRALLNGRGGEADEDDRRAERRRASDDGRTSRNSAPGCGDGAGRGSLRQRGRGARPLHRGEPWLSRRRSRPDRRRQARRASRPLRRRFARRLAGKRTATSRSLIDTLGKAGRTLHP